jgi:Tol biopolymer transport system component
VAVAVLPSVPADNANHAAKEANVLTTAFLLGPYLAWSPDGNWLVISGKDSPTERAALFLLSTETGEKRRLTSPPPHLLGDSCPALSPDGRALAFTRSADGGVGDLYLMALSAELKPLGEARRLTLGNRGDGKPAWTPDGREIIFSGASGQLWRIAPSGSAEPQRLVSLGEDVYEPTISPRGRRLAYVQVSTMGTSRASPRQVVMVPGA